jgi:hypothetical protein
MPTISSTSVPSSATATISSKDRESVRRRLFPSKIFTENGTQTGPDAETDATEAKSEVDLKCSICLEQTEDKNVTTTACGHMFCTSCLLKHLAVRNTCPNCRAEIESARAPAIEPLNATIVANIIREEETNIDLTRRIAVIGAFQDAEGRASMILSLARELAFGSAHSMAGWQGTNDDTYHASWSAYEYNGIDDDEEDEEDEDDEDDEEGDVGEGERMEINGDDASSDDASSDDDDDDDDESIDLDTIPTQLQSSPFMGEVREFTTQIFMNRPIVPVTRIAASHRSPFQSPQFQTVQTVHQDPIETMEYQQLIRRQPISQPAVSVEPPIRLFPSSGRGREIDYFDIFVGNFIRVTIFAVFLFVSSR